MFVESAADLASMFDEDEFAEPASYQPDGGGDSQPCSVIVDRGQGRRPYKAGETRISTSERMLSVQKSELAVVARDGIFTMLDEEGAATGEVFTVAGRPKLDHLAVLWSVELLISE